MYNICVVYFYWKDSLKNLIPSDNLLCFLNLETFSALTFGFVQIWTLNHVTGLVAPVRCHVTRPWCCPCSQGKSVDGVILPVMLPTSTQREYRGLGELASQTFYHLNDTKQKYVSGKSSTIQLCIYVIQAYVNTWSLITGEDVQQSKSSQRAGRNGNATRSCCEPDAAGSKPV